MFSHVHAPGRLLHCVLPAVLTSGLALLLSAGEPAGLGRQSGSLRIGTSGALTSTANEVKEKAALVSLKNLIKDETGLDNEFLRQSDWRELADKMASGQIQVGVFQGYEFAWAREKHPDLKALVLAVAGQRYPVAYVVTRKDSKATDFKGLAGQAVTISGAAPVFARRFAEREARGSDKNLQEFFSKVESPENTEDALDDVVDGKVQAAVVDRASLEAYRRRKPGRFKQIKPISQSKPVLPVMIAHYDDNLDRATRRRFHDGLVNAGRTDRGQTMLTLFRLTGFDEVPADFDQVLKQTLEVFPPPEAAGD